MFEDGMSLTFGIQAIIGLMLSVLGWLGSRLFNKVEEIVNSVNNWRIESASINAELKFKLEQMRKDLDRLIDTRDNEEKEK